MAKKSRVARHRTASRVAKQPKGGGLEKNGASHVAPVNVPEVTPPAQAAYSDPVIQGDIVGIFASALSLADIMDRVHSISVIEETHGMFRSSLPLRIRIENGLKSIGTISEIPNSVWDELRELAKIFQDLRLNCISIPDVCYFLAKADLRGPAWRGWQAVVAANPANQNLYPWAAECAMAGNGDSADSDRGGNKSRLEEVLSGEQKSLEGSIAVQLAAANGTTEGVTDNASIESLGGYSDLSPTKLLILRALVALGATDESRKVPSSKIAKYLRMDADECLRRELSQLRQLKLLGGAKGTRGYWLSSIGFAEAKKPAQCV